MSRRACVRLALATLLVMAAAVPAAFAQLARVGPVDPANGGYPAWYQDKTGLTMDFGLPANQAELNGGWLLILPANLPTGATPEVFPTNYSPEHFYWNATSGSRVAGGMVLVLSMEAAFSGGAPKAGDQITFGRLRIKIASIPTSGDYKVYTPFGVFDFPGLVQGDRLFFTSDVGFACGTNFECALNSSIGRFLLPSPYPGGPEVPPIPDLVAGQDPWYDALAAKTAYPGTGKKYIADPARVGPLTGGTCTLTGGTLPGDCVMGNPPGDPPNTPPRPVYMTSGGLRDPNIFRVEVNGVEVPPAAGGEYAFTTAGRVFKPAGGIPSKLTVDRASYGETAAGEKKLDVFVTAFPTMNPRLPAGGAALTSNPDMGYYDTACGTDANGNPTAPTATDAAGVPVTYYQMFRNSLTGNTWWGQNAPLAIPSQVCVLDNGRVVPGYFPANVADDVAIVSAIYTPSTATLTVDAVTSDCFTNPMLTLDGFGAMTLNSGNCTNSFSLSNLVAPPAKVSVTSLRGGLDTKDVSTSVGTPVLMGVVVTNADTLTTPEDCSATSATSCAAPVSANVLANDTLNGGAVSGASVAIATMPVNGSATIGASNEIVYTPIPNYNGPDLVGYTVTTGAGIVSAEGYLHITVTPVNDAPTAVNDASGAPNNKPVTINVLGNDTDPDGAADLAAAVIRSLPGGTATITCNGGAAAVVGTVCAGGNITFTGSGGGTVFTFTYQARDSALALSANTATVVVTVNATEAIVVTKSIFTAKSLRWVVAGTDSLIASQTLTVKYDIATPPTYKVNGVCTAMTAATNPVIGTAAVDALGNWTLDVTVNSAGTINPTNTGSNGTGFWCSPPRAVRVISPLGGTASSNISFK